MCPKCGRECAVWKLYQKHLGSGKRGRPVKRVVDVPPAEVPEERVGVRD